MLDSLRAFSRTWYAKIFFAVLVLSFALFGISNVIFDLGTNTVARVGDQEITLEEFNRAYQNQLNNVAQQFGQVPTTEMAVALGLPNQVIFQLAAEAAINDIGMKFGLGVSEARLGKMLREDPTFAGTLGQFDRQNFVRALQQLGYTEAEYFDIQTRASRRQQLASALFADSTVPDTAVQLINRYTGDTRTLEYFVLNDLSIPSVAEPTEAEMLAYLAENQEQYRTDETRTVDVLALSPDVLAAQKVIPEEQIVAEYERTKTTLTRPERRTIRQAVLPDEVVTATFQAGKADGRSFDDLVDEADIPVTELGTLSQSEISDATLATAAFGLAQGDFVVIPGIGGQRAVSVSAIEAGGDVSLDDARADITNRLALAQARTEYLDVLDQIEELRAAFQPLSEIAGRFGLTPQEVVVSAGGSELSVVTELPETERGRVAGAIFAAEQDKLASTVVLGANRHIWYDLKSIEPARDRTIDEVREALRLALVEQRTDDAMASMVEEILAQLRAGLPFQDMAISRGQFPILSTPIGRGGDGTPVFTRQVAASAFAGGIGHYGAAQNEDGDYVVFQVVEIIPAAEDTTEQARGFVAEATRDTLYSDFVSGLRSDVGVRINQQAVNQMLALDTVR